MKKVMLVFMLIGLISLSGCTDQKNDNSKDPDKKKSVEFNASDIGTFTDSSGNDIVFDFKNPENKDKIVITPK